MKQSLKRNRAMLIIGLFLILALLFANKRLTNSNQQSEGNTTNPVTSPSPVVTPSSTAFTGWTIMPDFPTPAALTLTAMPTPSSTTTSTLAPPACTFPLAGTTAEESTPEEYIFSEPQVVLTGIANIIEWLPNNQQVLLTRRLDKNSGHQEIILLDPQSNEIQVYAERESINEQPIWIDGANAVAYPVVNILNKTSDGKFVSPADIQLQLWLSRGDPNHAELIEEKEMTLDYLPYLSIASKPGSGQIMYRTSIDQEFTQRDLSTTSFNVLQSLPFDASRWEYRKDFRPLSIYDMTWRPNSSQVFLYTNGDIGGYTFLFDSNTGQICELSLDREGNESGWALNARWSSNGRYLAVARTWGMRPIKTSDLVVIDMATGELYVMNLTPPDMDGQHFVIDIAWAPDNLHLAAVAQVREQNPSSSDHDYRKIGNFSKSQIEEKRK
ncbi:MAG: hypothetical protein HYZ24_10250 [Chloroflexi bacterium]|nr:hypothetical protein [Chloroflexota bacterium]